MSVGSPLTCCPTGPIARTRQHLLHDCRQRQPDVFGIGASSSRYSLIHVVIIAAAEGPHRSQYPTFMAISLALADRAQVSSLPTTSRLTISRRGDRPRHPRGRLPAGRGACCRNYSSGSPSSPPARGIAKPRRYRSNKTSISADMTRRPGRVPSGRRSTRDTGRATHSLRSSPTQMSARGDDEPSSLFTWLPGTCLFHNYWVDMEQLPTPWVPW